MFSRQIFHSYLWYISRSKFIYPTTWFYNKMRCFSRVFSKIYCTTTTKVLLNVDGSYSNPFIQCAVCRVLPNNLFHMCHLHALNYLNICRERTSPLACTKWRQRQQIIRKVVFAIMSRIACYHTIFKRNSEGAIRERSDTRDGTNMIWNQNRNAVHWN